MSDNLKELGEGEVLAAVSEETISERANLAILNGPLNGKVYVIGTAHFSEESQREVLELMKKVRPDRVVLELCASRANILHLDEAAIIRDAQEMNMRKMIETIKSNPSRVQGVLQALLGQFYANVTKELGMAPGGEFRVAYQQALTIPDCKVILGDMPIRLTFKRGFNSLPWYRKLKLAWILLTTDPRITKEDIEELKKSDMLDALLKEFGASFPEFKKVLIDERDAYLTHSLQAAAQAAPNDFISGGFAPSTVVGVVGLGHLAGIKNNWDKQIDLSHILEKNEESIAKAKKGFAMPVLKLGVLASLTYLGYRFIRRRY